MSYLIIRADARDLPLPDASVDLIVTSPPYWSLRSYSDEGEHYDGQIGSEPTMGEYLGNLRDCTAEWARVLKPEGSMFVNLGDKYGRGTRRTVHGSNSKTAYAGADSCVPTGNDKSLLGLPWRYALSCIDHLGLILRSEIIWEKPNCLPESVKDRVRRSHEQIFHFTKQQRYYAAVDEVREPHSEGTHPGRKRSVGNASGNGVTHRTFAGNTDSFSPLGKLPGSVWAIPSQPLKVPERVGVSHYAAYPVALVRPIILGWSPPGICLDCGQGRYPVSNADHGDVDYSLSEVRASERIAAANGALSGGTKRSTLGHMVTRTITGYACACTPRTSHRGKRGDWREGRQVMPDHGSDDWHSPGNAVPRRPGGFGTKVPLSAGEWEYRFDQWEPAPTNPGVVLDPFGGTGTTAMTADVLDRVGISVDMSADYCRLARWRCADPAQRAKVLGIPAKKKKAVPAQASLFDDG